MKHGLVMTLLMLCMTFTAQAGQVLSCDFPHVGTKQFIRDDATGDFMSPKDGRWQTLETNQFLQLRSPDINEEYVTNPFTVYLYDKKSKRMRQISAAMRAAPMMADGQCELSLD